MNGESKLRKLLFNEVSFLVAVLAGAFSLVNWISAPSNANAQRLQDVVQKVQAIEIRAEADKDTIKRHEDTIKRLDDLITQTSNDLSAIRGALEQRFGISKLR